MNSAWIEALPPILRNKLTGRHNLQKIIGNTGWLFADKILRMGVGLFIGAWVARYLGPEQFGTLSYATAFVALFLPFATLGLDGIVVRDLVNEPLNQAKVMGTAFVLRVLGSIFTLCLTVMAIIWIRPDDTLTHWLVIIISIGTIFQAFDIIDLWFQSQVQSKYTVWVKNLAFLLIALVRATLIFGQFPLIAFAWAGLVEIMLGAVGLLMIYGLNGHHISQWRGELARAKQLLRQSWPLVLSGLSVMIYMKIDQIMLGQMIGNDAVGLYSAAIRISEIWYFIPLAIVSSVFPSIIEAKKVSEILYYQRLQKLFNLMTALSVIVAIIMTILSNIIIQILFGEHYAAAGTILAIHIWAAVFVFLGVAQSPWDITEGLTTIALQRTIMGAIINIMLNLVLIPSYQGIGAAIATVVAYAFSAFMLNSVYRKTQPIFLAQAKSFFFFMNPR